MKLFVVIVLGAVIVGGIIYGITLYEPAPWDDDDDNVG